MSRNEVEPKPIRTLAALARWLGVAKQTCSNWLEAGCPRNQDGTFDPVAVREWARSRRKHALGLSPSAVSAAGEGVGDAGSEDGAAAVRVDEMDEVSVAAAKRRADLEWARARAEMWKLDVAEKRGDLVSAKDVEVFVDRLASWQQQELLRWVETVNEQVDGMARAERGEFMDRAMRRMLETWKDEGVRMAMQSGRRVKE